jgi:hypothetical protein
MLCFLLSALVSCSPGMKPLGSTST